MEYVDYGYCRISTPKQSIERQERNILAAYPSAHIVKETFTGTKIAGRKDWNRLYKHIIQEAKTKKVRIIFDSVSRLSRNADEGCEIYEDLFNRDITLIFLKGKNINSDVFKKALQTQITERINTNNKLTDDLINSIIDALNTYTISIAKEQIRVAFEEAEHEVKNLHQGTSEGIKTAKLAGKQIGRIKGKKYTTKKEKIAKQIILKNSKDFYGTNTDPEVIKLADISRNTFYKYKAELKERADD